MDGRVAAPARTCVCLLTTVCVQVIYFLIARRCDQRARAMLINGSGVAGSAYGTVIAYKCILCRSNDQHVDKYYLIVTEGVRRVNCLILLRMLIVNHFSDIHWLLRECALL